MNAVQNPRPATGNSTLVACLVIFTLAFALRAGWGTWRYVIQDRTASLEFPDEEQYWNMARAFAAGKGLPDELGFQATRMPLYPMMLSDLTSFDNGMLIARIGQWVVSALAAVLAFMLAQTLFDARVGLVAGIAVALDPFLIFFSSLLLTETPAITVVILLWYLHARIPVDQPGSWSAWVKIGLVSGLAIYFREALAGLVLLALAMQVLCATRHRPARLARAGTAAVIVLLLLAPWAIRNQRLLGSPVPLTTRSGISLYDGVHEGATGASDLGEIKQMPAVRGLAELEWNRYFLDQAWSAIKSDPARILKLGLVKLARTWSPVPNATGYRDSPVRLVSALWMIPVSLLAVGSVLIVVSAQRGYPRIWLWLPAVYVSGVHFFFVGSVRYRLIAMPMLIVLAACTALALWGRCARRSESTNAD